MSDNCLQRADNIVHGSRNETYGDPKENHECTADLFSRFMRRRYGTFPTLTAEDVCWFNLCQKMSREAHCETDDGLTDIAGYTANIEIVRKGWSISEGKSVHQTTQTDPGEEWPAIDTHKPALDPDDEATESTIDICSKCCRDWHEGACEPLGIPLGPVSRCSSELAEAARYLSDPVHGHRESGR